MVTFRGRLFFFLFFPPFLKFSLLLKNANFSLPLLGPESLLSGSEQCLCSGVKIKPSAENTALGTVYILRIGLWWDMGYAQPLWSLAQRWFSLWELSATSIRLRLAVKHSGNASPIAVSNPKPSPCRCLSGCLIWGGKITQRKILRHETSSFRSPQWYQGTELKNHICLIRQSKAPERFVLTQEAQVMFY